VPKTYCYAVHPEQRDDNGFIPSVVYSGLVEHHPLMGKGINGTPHYWGKTWEEAQRLCGERNKELGLTKEDVANILESSRKANEMRR
jgi:hypothetical protein